VSVHRLPFQRSTNGVPWKLILPTAMHTLREGHETADSCAYLSGVGRRWTVQLSAAAEDVPIINIPKIATHPRHEISTALGRFGLKTAHALKPPPASVDSTVFL
jgi:hypothetical protein